jgi:cell division protein FtsI (penicillin-binding protein 3)
VTAASVPMMVRLPAWRARLAMALLLAAFLVLAGRSVYLQSMRTGFLQEKGEARYSRVLEVPATRGRILDRNGEALAISTPVKSVWAIPEDVKADAAQLKALAGLLQMDARQLARKLSDADRDFVYLKRQIPPEAAARVAALGIPGIHQQNEYRRYYPGGETMAHVIGFTGVDDAGQEGIELAHEAQLAAAA